MGLSQDAGVIRLAIFETIEDVFDAIAGVFEFSVELTLRTNSLRKVWGYRG